jgi:hypothetical protein
MAANAASALSESVPGRRFNLGDAVILIAGLAGSIAGLRSVAWLARFSARLEFWSKSLAALMGVSPWRFASCSPLAH